MSVDELKGYMMDDSTFLKWLLGLVASMGLLLFSWTHTRAASAHSKIDKERAINDAKINLIYAKIDESIARVDKCRNEIKKDLEVRMTEPHIKEYVGLKIEPLSNKIDQVHTDIKALLARS